MSLGLSRAWMCVEPRIDVPGMGLGMSRGPGCDSSLGMICPGWVWVGGEPFPCSRRRCSCSLPYLAAAPAARMS
eukprot:51570-Pelagomonas_calceolata.AAC.1